MKSYWKRHFSQSIKREYLLQSNINFLTTIGISEIESNDWERFRKSIFLMVSELPSIFFVYYIYILFFVCTLLKF